MNHKYLGYCCYERSDERMELPCFLGLGSKGEFIPLGWDYYDILANSKKGVKDNINLDSLWVEIYDEELQQPKHENRIRDTIRKLEVVFPDFKFFATSYPARHFEEYYSYGVDLNDEECEALMKESGIDKAYENLRMKLDKVDDPGIWRFPF